MSTWLNTYLAQACTIDPCGDAGGETLYGVIDRVRNPQALVSLYQIPTPPRIVRLFQGTPFEGLNDVSPLWVQMDAGSGEATTLEALCRTDRSGILLASRAEPEAALAHARQLLLMHSSTYGDSLARFYDPAFFCALALTVPANALYGPWDCVYTPPGNPADSNWRIWRLHERANENASAVAYPLSVEADTLDAVDALREWYWVRSQDAESVGHIPDEHLPMVLSNLRLLVAHGIDESRHWAHLLPLLSRFDLSEQPESMQVLRSQMPAFEKIQRLEI